MCLVEGAEEGLALYLKSTIGQLGFDFRSGKTVATYFIEALFHVFERVAFAARYAARYTIDLGRIGRLCMSIAVFLFNRKENLLKFDYLLEKLEK